MGLLPLGTIKMTKFFFDQATYFFALLPKSYHFGKWAPMLKMFEIHPLSELSSNRPSPREILQDPHQVLEYCKQFYLTTVLEFKLNNQVLVFQGIFSTRTQYILLIGRERHPNTIFVVITKLQLRSLLRSPDTEVSHLPLMLAVVQSVS